jgi:anti-anti-sigma regulatory factor
MPFSITARQGKQILKLEGAVTIRYARQLSEMLVEGLEDGNPVVGVDTAGLEDIDTSILQILCSLRKSVPTLSFDSPSEAFSGAADHCGLRRELLGAREGL